MKRIIIVCSPRSGSNLLQFSLARHPDAINGSEWFNPNLRLYAPDIWLRKQNKGYFNLIKVFGYNERFAEFEEILSSGVIIHLRREDRTAQLKSWKRACETGVWLNCEHSYDKPTVLPENANALLDACDRYSERAALALTYEHLIANWKSSIEAILRIAEWPYVDLPMAIEKQIYKDTL